MLERIVKWKDCPHCGGRGWFLKNPFATGGGNGVGGPGNLRQCDTCKRVKVYFDDTGEIPPDIQTVVEAVKAATGYQPSVAELSAEINRLKAELEVLQAKNTELALDVDSLEAYCRSLLLRRELLDGMRSRDFTLSALRAIAVTEHDRFYVYYDVDNGFEIHSDLTTDELSLGWE